MSTAAKRLVVCGGSGFLGSRICKYAVARGWEVTSLSRSGEPKWKTISSSPDAPPWAHKVSWERADVLRPVTYASLLRGADYVVHSMGILFELDYKGLVSGRESPLAALRTLFASQTRNLGANPLERAPQEDIKPNDPKLQLSYEAMNRDSAIALARHAAEENVAAFGYISACGGGPIMPPRYLSTKREAEVAISQNFPQMRSLFFRPPFMYDPSRIFTMGMAAFVGAGTAFNDLTRRSFKDFLGAVGTKPLKVDLVAEAVVEGLSDDATKGPVELPEILELSGKAWRKAML
ncbi:hypothetical protein CDD81_4107 [Ophiocordyceps australis]|uniref:NAD-dependent epimerase/dehydratase domain-containing protein n=1 Tax=Ophiocordyceps australis TaxID=1399860 RepID=A0A2C5YAC9_9HYPO|nr:hypothetical protein CDD81_4107 [Ophiocordyceps australis]